MQDLAAERFCSRAANRSMRAPVWKILGAGRAATACAESPVREAPLREKPAARGRESKGSHARVSLAGTRRPLKLHAGSGGREVLLACGEPFYAGSGLENSRRRSRSDRLRRKSRPRGPAPGE